VVRCCFHGKTNLLSQEEAPAGFSFFRLGRSCGGCGLRRKYSSKAAWDREQEIIHDAGGGELVFAEILNRWRDKIIITDPKFEVPPFWNLVAGFDHGKTNPTAFFTHDDAARWVLFLHVAAVFGNLLRERFVA
jgi:hypothetical protein